MSDDPISLGRYWLVVLSLLGSACSSYTYQSKLDGVGRLEKTRPLAWVQALDVRVWDRTGLFEECQDWRCDDVESAARSAVYRLRYGWKAGAPLLLDEDPVQSDRVLYLKFEIRSKTRTTVSNAAAALTLTVIPWLTRADVEIEVTASRGKTGKQQILRRHLLGRAKITRIRSLLPFGHAFGYKAKSIQEALAADMVIAALQALDRHYAQESQRGAEP